MTSHLVLRKNVYFNASEKNEATKFTIYVTSIIYELNKCSENMLMLRNQHIIRGLSEQFVNLIDLIRLSFRFKKCLTNY